MEFFEYPTPNKEHPISNFAKR